MIGSLRGVVLDRGARTGGGAEVLVEVGGVGYRVAVPGGALSQIGPPGAAVFLHVHTHVRDDAIVLFGFLSREERVCFETLIGAHGVGPSVALALLSVHSPAALRRAVHGDDADALMLVPGIGHKTATRLIVELKSRLDLEDEEVDLRVVHANGDGGRGTRAEVRSALAGLGYGAEEIRHALVGVDDAGSVEDQLRNALRDLATVR